MVLLLYLHDSVVAASAVVIAAVDLGLALKPFISAFEGICVKFT